MSPETIRRLLKDLEHERQQLADRGYSILALYEAVEALLRKQIPE